MTRTMEFGDSSNVFPLVESVQVIIGTRLLILLTELSSGGYDLNSLGR